MFKYKFKYEHVDNIDVTKRNVIIRKKGGEILLNDILEKKCLAIGIGRNEEIIKVFEEEIFLYRNNSQLKIKKNVNSSLIFENGGIYVENIRINEENFKIEKDYYFYNFDNESTILLKEKSVGNIISLLKNSNVVYFEPSSIISSFSLLLLTTNWKTDIKDIGEVRKILGVQENKLWISMYRGGIDKNKKTLIALNIDSGQLIYESPNGCDISDWYIELLPEQNSILSIYGKISTSPADSPIVEINATTGEIIRNQKIESLYNENLKIGFWKVLEDKIYFTANKEVLNGTNIGVLDYNTLEILWVTKIDTMKGTFKDLQVSENKIYALDTANQLHIFEKE